MSYGLLGDFGRFRSLRPLGLCRGDRAVVQSHRGLETATVLRPATTRHAHFLPNTTVGQLLRRVSPEDEQALARMQQRGRELLDRALRLAGEFELPLELLDIEMLLDGRHAVLHYLHWADADLRPFVSTLAREFDVQVTLQDLTKESAPAPDEEEDHEHGCGREGCGRSAGGCSTCGTGGGCSSCGEKSPADLQAYFAGLREQMERQRVPLL